MADEARVEQFRKMAADDPNNELGHFSLGNALMEAGRHQEAAQSFQRVLALNSQYSKAYQMLGAAQKACGHTDLAIQTLRNGYLIAHKKGDLMPMRAMGELLKELGVEPPAVGVREGILAPASGGTVAGDATFACSRCGSPGPKMKERPFKGALGEKILAKVCANCWKEWVGMGTKVINELRLPMFDPQAQEVYDKHMKEFLSVD